MNQFVQLFHPLSGLGGNEQKRRVGHKAEIILQLFREFLHGLPIFFHRIPFVDRDDASLSLLMSISRHFGILFRKALGRINDNHAYIRAIHRHIGAQHRIFFDCFFHFCFAANASRIDKHKLAIFIFHKGIRGIPGRSCNIGNDYPLFTRHSVNQ